MITLIKKLELIGFDEDFVPEELRMVIE